MAAMKQGIKSRKPDNTYCKGKGKQGSLPKVDALQIARKTFE